MSVINNLEATQYDTGLETNIYAIAEQICSQPPKPPCSIQLMMGHDTDNKDLEFELLTDYTLACMRIKFGPDVNPQNMTEQQFDLLNNYVKSVGYSIVLEKQETEISYQFKISFKLYKPSKPNPFQHLSQYM